MKIVIGIIGPADSVEQILSVAKEFEDVEFIPYVYDELQEITNILQSHKQEVDQWFFSGVLNYSYAIEHQLLTEEEAGYPPLHGSSFFGILLEAQLASNQVYKKVSIDTVPNEEMDKILSFYNLNPLQYYNVPFSEYQDSKALAESHETLFNQGKVEVVITSIKAVYLALREKGIPSYRVMPSYLSIKTLIQFLVERAQSKRYRNSQVAVIGCQVQFDDENSDERYYSFKMKHRDLDLRRALLNVSENTNGSLMQMGDGLFFIFTTRGELSPASYQNLLQLMDDMREQAHIDMVLSIGFGVTVSQAEANVRLGFNNKPKEKEAAIVLVDEDRSITFKNKKEEVFVYQTMSIGDDWKEKIRDASVSTGIVSKILSYTKQYGQHEFSSQDVSKWLQSTERNGRRILTEMERCGLIEQCGEAQSGERGRPRKIYHFKK
ncbi:hypothetical protein LCM20_12605 [Halobacillus litoralis]|uniref:hypothetical protein n=1 Tax=Halobacillus litoralis TaxID=45668 RepID=UPI001CD24EDD|nr:hypothetical protein [Halobacillus litoralis]MCA0971438.1 hypothetical protein [Halobacillus litoralis]